MDWLKIVAGVTGAVVFIAAYIIFTRLGKRRINRAARSIIQIFHENNVIGVDNAKSIDELAVLPKADFLRRFLLGSVEVLALMEGYVVQDIPGWKIPKKDAWLELLKDHIIRRRADGKFYLSEAHLSISKWR